MSDRQFFAQIDENNVVLQVRVVTRQFLEANPDRYTGTWVETHFNHPTKMYAGIGYIYDPETEDFAPPPSDVE